MAHLAAKKGHRREGRSGFTLIELLVVIAILGLLASVVFASLNSARKKARVARAAADLREITKVLMFYYDDHNNYPCFDHNWSDTRERQWAAPYYRWPKTPWGTEYHWEHGQRGFAYSISLRAIGQEAAQALDRMMDDGNLATGVIRGDGNRLEYGGMDQTLPSTHCH